MAYTITDEGSGLDTTFDNSYVTKNELYTILEQLKTTERFYELEIFEVVNVDEVNVGEVTGRYVISEQGDSEEEVSDRIFLPLNSNIVQFPLRGELWLGMEYKGNHYYLSRLSEDIKNINFEAFNESTRIEEITTDLSRGGNFVDIKPAYADVKIGDTLFQGRFDNYIILGSDKNNDGTITIDNDTSFISMTTGEIPTTLINSDRIEIKANSDELDLLAQKNLKLASIDGDVLVQGNDNLTLEVLGSKIDMIYINGQKRDFANPNGDILLPKFIKEKAGDLKPLIDIIKAELLALPYLILPPVLPGGIPNPSFMIGMKIKYDVIKSYIELIQYFISLEWLPKFDFELVNLQEVLDALGLSSLPGLDELGGFEGILADIAAAKAKIEVLKGTVDGLKSKAAVVSNQVSQIQKGEFDGSPSDFIKTLDDFESDEQNPKIDTTDIREIIADGTLNSTEELTRYFQNGGSPHLAALSMEAGKRQQEVEQLDQVVQLAEITKLTQGE